MEGFLFLCLSILMTKAEKIAQFDPNGPGQIGSNLFGLPFTAAESEIIILPVPWEVTVSYGGGTAEGPAAILEASLQVDLFDPDAPDAWKSGFHLLEDDPDIKEESLVLRDRAELHIEALANGVPQEHAVELLASISEACEKMNAHVEEHTGKWLDAGKVVGLLGGDHSTPLGFMQALAKRHPSFGILQIDAHMDLRIAYEGFTYSHASIMYNALKIPQITKLVQLGIRDYCAEEIHVMQNHADRVKTYFDDQLKFNSYQGMTWKDQVTKIIADLPQLVYVSFDIDGLDPKLCPNTGTPVAGGLEYHQAVYLLSELSRSGKQIIGFDLNEVSPGEDEWDANVGARLLFKLCVFAGISKGLFPAAR